MAVQAANSDNASSVSISGPALGVNLVSGPVANTFSSGSHILDITESAAPTAAIVAGSDAVLNSGGISSTANAAGSTSIRVRFHLWLETRRPTFNGFDIDATDTVVLSGTLDDGTTRSVTLTTVGNRC